MPVLVTGAAGFIGRHVCRALLRRGEDVVGIDNLNSFYDPLLKRARLQELQSFDGFAFHEGDFADAGMLDQAVGGRAIDRVVHLGAQANVRYSIENPRVYVRSNLVGHLEVLEFCRAREIAHLVYASSSSVYGNASGASREDARADAPLSLYAATKRSDELIGPSYSHLYGIPQTGLRFFTVYGPWGRPDMAYWLFTDAILAGRPIRLFNNGRMWRDFTFISDIVDGILAVLDNPPADGAAMHRVYNIGNGNPVALGTMVETLERHLGVEAIREFAPMQPGDVEMTSADVSALERDFGCRPRVDIDEGLGLFVDWYRTHVPQRYGLAD